MKQKAEITFEVEETTVLREGEATLTELCPFCARMVEMASPRLIAATSGPSERKIFRLIESGQIHFTETGRVLVCCRSLRIFMEQEKYED